MNQVHIEPTEFTDVRTGNKHLGFRAWDDEAQSYDNSWDSIPADNDTFLKKVFQESVDAVLGSMFDYCRQYERGIFVGDDYLPFDHWTRLKKEADEEHRN